MKSNRKEYTTNEKKYSKTIKEYLYVFDIVSQKLKEICNFYIPNYVIDDIVKEESYSHFCLMINIAVINERISRKNAKFLKSKIKDISKIKNPYMNICKSLFISN